jgi:hypothetical protein
LILVEKILSIYGKKTINKNVLEGIASSSSVFSCLILLRRIEKIIFRIESLLGNHMDVHNYDNSGHNHHKEGISIIKPDQTLQILKRVIPDSVTNYSKY